MYFICYSISAPAGDFILVQFKCVHIDFSKFFILALFNITYYNSVVSVKLLFFPSVRRTVQSLPSSGKQNHAQISFITLQQDYFKNIKM